MTTQNRILQRKNTLVDQEDEALSRPSSLVHPSMLESKYQKSPRHSREKIIFDSPVSGNKHETESKTVIYGEIP